MFSVAGVPSKFTPEVRQKFLERLSENGGIVTDAAMVAGVVRNTCYEYRDADPEFRAAWEKALEVGHQRLEDEAKRRAFVGYDEDVYYQGQVVGKVRRYSDFLMTRILGARIPAYRLSRTELTGADGLPLEVATNVVIYLPDNGRDAAQVRVEPVANRIAGIVEK